MPLDDAAKRTVEGLERKMLPLKAELRKWKQAINLIYEANDESPPYLDEGDAPANPKKKYSRGEFHGQPLATVVKRIITEIGPQNEHELYDAMIDGGFGFDEPNAERAKNNLKISLGKNIAFTKMPNGFYNLSVTRSKRAASAAEPEKGEKAADELPEKDQETGQGAS